MKNIVVIVIVALLVVGGYLTYQANNTDIAAEMRETQAALEMESVLESELNQTARLENGPSIQPISHASMVLTWGDKSIYVDPVGGADTYADLMAPDIVLLTDIHGDHLNLETLEGVISPDSQLIAPQAVFDELTPALQSQTTIMANGDSLTLGEFVITAEPMYNVPEVDDSRHPKGRGNGYILERADFRTYIAGDTGPTEEMKALQDIDLAFIPMNMPYTMSVAEAAEATIAFAPRTAIPYHYRGEGGLSDVAAFKAQVEAAAPNTSVLLLNWYPVQADTDVGTTGAANDADESVGNVVSVDVSGFNFGYDISEIRVREGDTVTINFVSTDGFHDWVVDEFDAATEKVRPGTPTSVTFVADRAGTYEYYCSVGSHRAQGMVGTLIVE